MLKFTNSNRLQEQVIHTVSEVSKISVLSCSLLLVGCLNHSRFASLDDTSPSRTAGVSSTSERAVTTAVNPSSYLVKPGDTLYSIAFRFGLDYRKLASANRISAPYRIYPGQGIALKEAPVVTSSRPKPKPTSTSPSAEKPTNKPTETDVRQKPDVSTPVTKPQFSGVSGWEWPHSGKIVRTFKQGSSDRKGIDLVGRIGDSVKAAASGVVVYAGNGLPGYGNLIILEHSGSLLSAYAFNQTLNVTEGQQIQRGDTIATMGKQGDQPSLHFEIRRDGKPVNPLQYLPKR